ncbi:hypothetical protein PCE1_002739 [Barthelona sp. PCE]
MNLPLSQGIPYSAKKRTASAVENWSIEEGWRIPDGTRRGIDEASKRISVGKGSWIASRYECLEKVGVGTFGMVTKVIDHFYVHKCEVVQGQAKQRVIEIPNNGIVGLKLSNSCRTLLNEFLSVAHLFVDLFASEAFHLTHIVGFSIVPQLRNEETMSTFVLPPSLVQHSATTVSPTCLAGFMKSVPHTWRSLPDTRIHNFHALFSDIQRSVVDLSAVVLKYQFCTEADILKHVYQERMADPDYKYFGAFTLHQIQMTLIASNFFDYAGIYCMTLEFCSCNIHQLQKAMGGFPLSAIRTLAPQMCHAIRGLRKARIIHSDIKPENIMLSLENVLPLSLPVDKTVVVLSEMLRSDASVWGRLNIKVVDFSSVVDVAGTSGYHQTRPYRAPEVILGCPMSHKSDMWSLGCVLAEMYIGKPLFLAANYLETMRLIVETVGPLLIPKTPAHSSFWARPECRHALMHPDRGLSHFFYRAPSGDLILPPTFLYGYQVKKSRHQDNLCYYQPVDGVKAKSTYRVPVVIGIDYWNAYLERYGMKEWTCVASTTSEPGKVFFVNSRINESMWYPPCVPRFNT